jgi:ABC-2 type transport system ATP-binding protein
VQAQRGDEQDQEGGGIPRGCPALSLWQRLVDRPDRPERLLGRFELDAKRDVPVARLSGGEKRRLDLALAVWGRRSW